MPNWKSVLKPVLWCLILAALFFGYNAYGRYRERPQYFTHEAYIEVTDYETLKIPCVVDVVKSGNQYNVLDIYYPFGKTGYCDDEEFDQETMTATVRIPGHESSYDAVIVLQSEADESSMKELSDRYNRGIGEAYALEGSDVFHIRFSDPCPYAEESSPENEIVFYDYRDADIMGYEMCDWCHENW